jgi:NAD(P)-dependent dehydrogenase (short-subunit alcohol dehydrogenase family)
MALLKGRTAIITGGSTGIGSATAKRFVEEGAYVFINGRSQTELDAAIKQIGENVTGVQGDGSKPGDRDRLYTAVADSGRSLDIVFANAAAIHVSRIGAATQEHLQKALPALNDGGAIILNAADPDAEDNDDIDAHAAILTALRPLARILASQLQGRNIRVGVISPGAAETLDIHKLAEMPNPGPDIAEESETYRPSAVPPTRYSTAGEVAHAAVLLASDRT